MSSTLPTEQSWFRRNLRPRRKLLVATVAVGALVLPAAVAWAAVNDPFNDMKPGSKASAEVTEIADAGIMTGFPDGGFHPYEKVDRVLLARSLHRALPRLSLTRDVGDFPTSDDGNERALLGMSIDGYQRGSQAVLVTLNMEVTSTGVTADCTTHLEVQSQPYSFEAGTWEFTLSPGGPTHRQVSATFMAPQRAGTAYTYALYGHTDCPNPVQVQSGMMTAQTFAFNGQGNAYQE